jgi:hypothetical protein
MKDLEKTMAITDKFMSLTTQDLPDDYAINLAIILSYCHMDTPLDLDAMLNTDDRFSFMHDIVGINNHWDATSRRLTGCFLPRFALRQSI